jgi:NAD(P)-dependent dehydrogenase (short-subunit alcohol dehydrogenase family)
LQVPFNRYEEHGGESTTDPSIDHIRYIGYGQPNQGKDHNAVNRLKDKIAIVTGAEGGLGNVIAGVLLEEGATVLGIDVLAEPREGSSLGAENAVYAQVDITDETALGAAIDAFAEEYGRPNVLVNTAGVLGPARPGYLTTSDEFDFVFSVNVKGTWAVSKAVVPHMIAGGGGSIINFSSIAGLVGGTSALALYHAAKGAVRLMSKADAADLAQYGIRVNSLHPGSIDTPMALAAAQNNPAGADQHSQRIIADHLLKRRGTPREVANGVLFLASDESSFVTGTELVVDGGYTAH